MAKKPSDPKSVESLKHDEAKRKNIPTAEYQSVLEKQAQAPLRVEYERRNRDLDPQLVWRGKDQQDLSELVVQAPPLYIQEKVHAKALIDDLLRETKERAHEKGQTTADLFSDFNGIPKGADKTEFYKHDQNWSNRMILGDSLQVMASLAGREGLRGKVQCIYFDPPYGIKFNSNFQWSTTSRDVKDGNAGHITREPEQVKAFRDTWRDGIHSYLTYLRDRLVAARDLLTESGSLFVQIGDENLHLVKSVLCEVFGESNYVNTIAVKKKGSTLVTESMFDFIVWFCRNSASVRAKRLLALRGSPEEDVKFNTLIAPSGEMARTVDLEPATLAEKVAKGWRWARVNYPIVSQDPHEVQSKDYEYRGLSKKCGKTRHWTFANPEGLRRIERADRLFDGGGDSLGGVVFHEDRQAIAVGNLWDDVKGEENPIYVVQTAWRVVQRCLLLTTEPGDLVLDPTCGSATTAFVAEQMGRRWITIDTSRVALALARARIMGARYPYYILRDSIDGQRKEAELTRSAHSSVPVHSDIRHGFVYERVPQVTLKSIANNTEIDVVWDKWQRELEPLRGQLNSALKKKWQEWEIPREPESGWSAAAVKLHADWWQARISRQREIDASIAAKAEYEYLYDKPYEDKKKVRVAGPFTVESLSPHRVIGVGDEGDFLGVSEPVDEYAARQTFPQMVLENLKTAGVQQAHKEDKIVFTSLVPWPGRLVCAEGRYQEGNNETGAQKRAAIFIGPEFGTVTRPDLVEAAREAGDADFDVLIACAFNFEAHAAEFSKLGRIPVLKARMNADLHMAEDLKNTGKGNLFVIFGEPDITLLPEGKDKLRVKVNGVDVFDPSTGEVRSDGPDGIACWFVDTDYNEESFFVRHAYFLGANDPYTALKTTLKAEIDREAWETLHSDTSRAFMKPKSGRIAVKVINHLGDEVMKVFRVS